MGIGSVLLTSVCLVIGFSLRKRGLSMISHTWKRGMMDKCQCPYFFSPPSSILYRSMHMCEHVYLLMDVDVRGVRWPAGGVPTQKLQLLEYLFNWRGRGQSTKYFFKPSFLNLKLLVYFHQLLLSPSNPGSF